MENNFGRIYGMEIIKSEHMVETKFIQRKKHRKKRIDKKWSKYGYYYIETPINKVYLMGNKIAAHPEIMKKIIELCDQSEVLSKG